MNSINVARGIDIVKTTAAGRITSLKGNVLNGKKT